MKKYLLTIFGLLILSCSFSQETIKKILFFNQDSIFSVDCGNSEEVTVISFINDTSSSKKHASEYFLAVACIERFGEDFFKKGQKYSLMMHKNFEKIERIIEPDIYKLYLKKENFYVLADARKEL